LNAFHGVSFQWVNLEAVVEIHALDLAFGRSDEHPYTPVPGTLARAIPRDLAASRQLEEIAFSKPNAIAFFTELALERRADAKVQM
jgi:hypothetical protein